MTNRNPLLQTTLFLAVTLLGLSSIACHQTPGTEALEQVADSPREVAGETVTVEGRIHKILGNCAFELEAGGVSGFDRVLTLCEPAGAGEQPPVAPQAVSEGDWLRVTGVAGEMTRENYEFKTTLTLPDDVFDARETRPVIFVQKAEKVVKSEPSGEARLPEAPVVVPLL